MNEACIAWAIPKEAEKPVDVRIKKWEVYKKTIKPKRMTEFAMNGGITHEKLFEYGFISP
jgi:hypothetical protein